MALGGLVALVLAGARVLSAAAASATGWPSEAATSHVPIQYEPSLAPGRALSPSTATNTMHVVLEGFVLEAGANGKYLIRNATAYQVNGRETYWSFEGMVLYLCGGGARWYGATMNDGHWARIVQGECLGSIRGPAGATELTEGSGDWEEKTACDGGGASPGDVDVSDDDSADENQTSTTTTTTTTAECALWVVGVGRISEIASGAPDEKPILVLHLDGFSQAELNTAYIREDDSEEQIAGREVFWSVGGKTFIAKCPDLDAWGVFSAADFDEVSSGECSARLATSPPGDLFDSERLLQDWSEHLFGSHVPRPGSGVQRIGRTTTARFTTSSTTSTTTTTTTMADPYIVTNPGSNEGAGVINVVAAVAATVGFLCFGLGALQGARRLSGKSKKGPGGACGWSSDAGAAGAAGAGADVERGLPANATPAFAAGAVVECLSEGTRRWRRCVVRSFAASAAGPHDPELVYSLGPDAAAAWGVSAAPEEVSASSIRVPFAPGESVEVLSQRLSGRWIAARILSEQEGGSYRVELGPGEGAAPDAAARAQVLERVPAENLRRRFPVGSAVKAYGGPSAGWRDAVVAGEPKEAAVDLDPTAEAGGPDRHWTLVPVRTRGRTAGGAQSEAEGSEMLWVPSYFLARSVSL